MKGNYHAVEFQLFRISDRLEDLLHDTQSLTIGVDIAKHQHVACVMKGIEEFAIFHFRSDDVGEFANWAAGLGVEVTVLVEPTGTYGDPLVAALRGREIIVRQVPAKRTHDLRDLFDNVSSKFDGKDAYLLARLHLISLSEELRTMTAEQRQLRAVHAALGDVQDDIERLSGKLESMLARHWPEATSSLGLSSITFLTVLIEFGGPAQVAAQPEAVAKRMRRVGRTMLGGEKIDGLIAAAQRSEGVEMLDQELWTLQRRAQKLLTARTEERETKKKLKSYAQASPELAHLTEFCGPALATALVAYLGYAQQFDEAAAFEKCAGMNLKWFQSGESRPAGIHISKRGPEQVRRLLFFFALRMIQRSGCAIARAWYRRRLELNGGHKLKAIVALMRKLMRGLFHVAQGADYDATKLFDTSRLQVQPI